MGLSCLSCFCEGLAEALLEFTAALTPGDAASPSPSLATGESEHSPDKAHGTGLKASEQKGLSGKPSPELQQPHSMLSPALNATLTLFLRVVYGHPEV